MEVLALAAEYIAWHYTQALRDIVRIWGNILWFLYHFFSIPLLTKTFFAPWRRMSDRYQKGLHIEQFFETLIVNTLMRLVGMVFRTAVILAGLLSLIGALVLGFLILIFWILIPLWLLILFFLALRSFSHAL